MNPNERTGFDDQIADLRALLEDDPGAALPLVEDLHDRSRDEGDDLRATAAYLLGQARAATGDIAGAEELVRDAQARWERVDNQVQAVRTRAGLMQLLTTTGRSDDAIRTGLDGLDLLAEGPPDPAAGEVLGLLHQNIGVAAGHVGSFQMALDSYDRAAEAYRTSGCHERLPFLAANRAAELLDLGRVGEALVELEHARMSAETVGSGALVARCDAMSGWGQVLAGNPDLGIRHLRSAVDGFRAGAMRVDAELAMLRLGEAHLLLSDWPEAAAVFDALLAPDTPIATITRCAARTGAAAATIGQGHLGAARHELEAAIDAWDTAGNLPGAITARLELAGLLLAVGDQDAAIAASLDAADSLGTDGPERYPLQMLYVTLRLVDVLLPDHEAARPYAEQGVTIATRLGIPLLVCRARRRLGSVELAAGDATAAEPHLRETIALGEALRARLPREGQRLSFGDDVDLALSMITDILIDQGTVASVNEAAALADRRRDRVLRELLDGTVQLDRLEPATGPDPFDTAMTAVSDALLDADSPRRAAALREHVRGLVEAQPERTHVTSSGAAVAAERPKPAPFARREHIGHDRIGADDSSAAVIAYTVVGERLAAFVTRGSLTRAVRLDADTRSVAELLEELDAELWQAGVSARAALDGTHPFTRSANGLLRRIGAILIDPLAHLLPRVAGRGSWQVVPHGLLHDVPFHGLITTDGPLVDQAAITICPNLSFTAPAGHRAGRGRRVLTIGLPTAGIPGVADELAAFGASGLPTEVLIGAEATSQALATAAARADILHLAGHGEFDRDHPRRSRLHLADGSITADEVARLDLQGMTVIVSACESGRAGYRAPTGAAIGLGRAFLAAGAHHVLASRWLLDDRVAAETTAALARALADGLPVSAALRRAQQEQRTTTPHPAHWAAFSVLGHPDPPEVYR
jgi:tetratricopeptide (TPR) repeat protein